MLLSKKEIFTGNSKAVFHYGKLANLMLNKNFLIRFCFKNQELSFFGIIVECDDHRYDSVNEYIICAPKKYLVNFFTKPVQEREIRKIVPRSLNIAQALLLRTPGAQLVHQYLPGFDEIVLPVLGVQESFDVRVYEDDHEYAFVRVFAKKDVPFSVCDPNKDVSFEKPELPMMFEVNGDNAKNPIKIFVGKPNFSKETFLINTKGIRLASLGSVVFDPNNGKFFAMICEIKSNHFVRCVGLFDILKNFADWNDITTEGVIAK
ncbi:hypothetical protein IT403_00285 [Candidatus Nomurabacteria bacterium]|nr:hypothetical protein [Candidatus Nomurabacteria bacterium]